jgi:D,D-heptose 1,7-bisphosphate phosphatase
VESLRFSTKKKALFLDRDGVINEDVDHLSDIDLFALIPNVGKAIRKANQAGMLVVVVSNQPVIARGELSVSNLRLIHNKLDTLLGAEGAYIDRLYYCPHHPDSGFDGEIKALKVECDCRKPNPGLFFQAVEELNISLQDSWVVGDRTSDILAGINSNIETILVKTGYAGKDARYTVNPNYVVADLAAAVELVLQNVLGK